MSEGVSAASSRPDRADLDNLTQMAARNFYDAYRIPGYNSRYEQLAYLLTSLVLNPDNENVFRASYLRSWRNYSTEQFEIVNDSPFPFKNNRMEFWRGAERIVCASFTPAQRFNPADDSELVSAVIEHDDRKMMFTPPWAFRVGGESGDKQLG